MAEERWVIFRGRRGGDGPEKATRLGDFGGDGRLQLSSVAVGNGLASLLLGFLRREIFALFFPFFALILIILCCYFPIIFDIFPN
jgi:hypothetical protein